MPFPQSSTPSVRRSWFAFSLRSLLVLTALCAVWLGIVTHQARRQRAAVTALKAAGAQVYYDFQRHAPGTNQPPEKRGPRWLRDFLGDDYFQDVIHVNWSNQKLNSSDMRWLADLPKLDDVCLNYTNVDDEGLANLSKLRYMKDVRLEDCPNVTDAGLACLVGLEDIESLALIGTSCSDAGLREYVPQFKRLTYLDVGGIPITNETAKRFAGLKRLRMLHLTRGERQLHTI
jgi:hypothetical protein